MTYKEAWFELKARLQRADFEIWKLVDYKTSDDEMIRLRGKHEGINLGTSYMDEVEDILE